MWIVLLNVSMSGDGVRLLNMKPTSIALTLINSNGYRDSEEK